MKKKNRFIQKLYRKTIAWLLAIILVFGMAETAFCETKNVRAQSEAPVYMAQLTGKYIWVYQSVRANPGETYYFSCDYYVTPASNAQATIFRWSSQDDNENGKMQTMAAGKKGSVELSYTAEDIDNNVMIRLEGTTEETICYVWNCSLTIEGSNDNLLKNPDFTDGDGSWNGWTIDNKYCDETVKEERGQKIVEYDAGLFLDKEYMIELHGTHIDSDNIMQTYTNIYQQYIMEAGCTYVFRCSYYDRAADGNASILLYSDKTINNEQADEEGRLRRTTISGKQGELQLSYTAVEDDEVLTVALECEPDSICYMWDFSLTLSDGTVNLLENEEFKRGGGSFIDWSVKGQEITTVEQSQAVTERYGHKIVEYSEEIIESMKTEDAGKKNYEDPNVNFNKENLNQYREIDMDNQAYMLGLNRTMNETTSEWYWIYQAIKPEAGVTYVLYCDYYMPSDASPDTCGISIWSSTCDYDKNVKSIVPGTSGTIKLEYTATTDDTDVLVRIEYGLGVKVYLSNMTLVEKDSQTNLLTNGDFSEDFGSLIGWTVDKTSITDKLVSNMTSENYKYDVQTYNAEYFNSGMVTWSVRPMVTDTIDFTYCLEFHQDVTMENSPNLLVSMYDGTSLVEEKVVQGDYGEDGRYYFHFPVLPQQMSYTIRAVLLVETSDEKIIRQTKQYSMEDYCISALKTDSDTLKTLIADMIAYGSEVQSKIGVQDTLAKKLSTLMKQQGSTGELSNISESIVSNIVDDQTGEIFKWKSASLVLSGKVTARFKFETETEVDLSKLSITVFNTTYTKDGQHRFYPLTDGSWYVDVPISASRYGDIIEAVCYNSDGMQLGKRLTYSVNTYLYRKQELIGYQDLFQSLYRYGQSANSYKTWMEQGNSVSVAENSYYFISKDNVSSRMNPQVGGADKAADLLREQIMNTVDDSSIKATGRTYYISEKNGDDANNGLSVQKAWKTLAAYRDHLEELKSGDRVLLERGGVYRGVIKDKTVFSLVSGVSYGAYGEGAKPAIYGSQRNYTGLDAWQRTDTDNIWVCSQNISNDAGSIVFNHGQAVGVKRLSCSEVLTENLAQLKNNFEFYHDSTDGKLYVYMEFHPGLNFYDIEICENSYMLLGDENSQNITIDNISLKYSGGHGIRFHDGANEITITNCEIGYMGGSIQTQGKDVRYGNGIEFWNGCSNITVSGNWIYQIYDAGFSHQGEDIGGYVQEKISFKNNLVEYCSFALEFWAGNPTKDKMQDILYANNMLRLTGYGWGVVRPSTWGVAAINTWGYSNTYETKNFVIENNVFDLSKKALFVAYYDTMPEITYSDNSYYLKEGYVALWQKRLYLAAENQQTMETSVKEIDISPTAIQYLIQQ